MPRLLAAGILTLVAISTLAVATGAARQTPPASQSRIAGAWKINKELSSAPLEAGPQRGQRPGGAPGGVGRGGFGGGGRRGGGGFGGGRGRSNVEQSLQTRVLMRELSESPEQLSIVVVNDASVAITPDAGVTRTFLTNGKKQKIEFGTARIDTKAKWDKDVLNLEMSASSFTIVETLHASEDGTQLIVTVKMPKGNRGGSVPERRRVYDRQSGSPAR